MNDYEDDYEVIVTCRKCGEEFENTDEFEDIDLCSRCRKDIKGQIIFDFE
jgi:predicted Zn-ribbon and HTH transcriptional regulator